MKKYQANLLLFLVAVIWGGGFVFVQILLDAGLSAGLISALRGLIFSVCTFIIFFKQIRKTTLRDFKVGLIAGLTNALGFVFQTIGQSFTSASHTSLITTTYVIFVPIVGCIFYGAKPGLKSAIAVLMCVLGAFLLVYNFSGESDGGAFLGDMLVLAGALMFGVNIAYLGRRGQDTHYGVVSFFMGVILFVLSALCIPFEGEFYFPQKNIGTVIVSILYLGMLSSCLCQILQVVCQRHTSPVSASMILTLEGFFGGLLSVMYGEQMTWNLVVGGVIITLAVFAQECDLKRLILKLKRKKTAEK